MSRHPSATSHHLSAASDRNGPPAPPVAAVRFTRTERAGLVVAGVLLVAFVGLAGRSHAEAQCRDIVETWSSGASTVIGSTCDAEPTPQPADAEPDEAPVRHPDPEAVWS